MLRLAGLSWLAPAFLVSLLLGAGLALAPAQTEAAYAATELARLPRGSSRIVRAGNDAGEIVGSARRGGGHRGFLLKSGPLQEIGGLPGSDYNAALGINNLGQVVGSANTPTGMGLSAPGIDALGTLPRRQRQRSVGHETLGTGGSGRRLTPAVPSRRYRCLPAATRPQGQGGAGLYEGMGSGSEASFSRGVMTSPLGGAYLYSALARLLPSINSVICLPYPCSRCREDLCSCARGL